MKIKLLGMLALSLLLCCGAGAQTRVTKKAREFVKNPVLVFKGVTGSDAAASQTLNFLRSCDWFDVTTTGQGDYSLSGTYSGGTLSLTVFNASGLADFKVNAPVNDSSFRAPAKKAVDAILQRIFEIKGICSTAIVFCAQTGPVIKNIYICDIDGGDIKKITDYKTLCVEPEWFPDGRSVVYTLYGKSWTDIIQTNLSPWQSRRLASYPGLNAGASISPNGQSMAMILSSDRNVDLYVQSLAGGSRRRLTMGRAVEASPCWNSSGSSLCFVSDVSGMPALYTVSASGGAMKRLATIGSEAVSPAWSQDNKIAYSAKMGGSYVLSVLDLSGKGPSGVVVNAAGDWESPSWAPDNRHLVCSRQLGKKASLYVVDTWTGKMRCVLTGNSSFSMPSWSNMIR